MTTNFEIADRRIQRLLGRLKQQGVCGCCTARALIYNGATICEEVLGSAEASEELAAISRALSENNVPSPRDTNRH